LIVVDSREPKKMVAELRRLGVNVAVAALDVGDYRVVSGDRVACVERKTASDFAASILDGRLWSQASRLVECGVPVFVVEGGLGVAAKFGGVSREALSGALARLVVSGVIVVSVPGWKWTAAFLRSLDAKLGGPSVVLPSVVKSGGDAMMLLAAALLAVPGVGRATARLVAGEYASVAEILADCGARLKGKLPDRKLKRILAALGAQECKHEQTITTSTSKRHSKRKQQTPQHKHHSGKPET